MPLNDLQKQAVEYLDGPLLVLAGPGTGKTQLLSSKVEYILKNTDANPENILCLTFTESGASNMRNRLRSMIGQAAGKVNIHTYHAFGSDIIAKYKNYATSDEYDRNLDTPIDTVTQYKIIHEIQESLPPFDIMKTAKTRDIIDTISSAKSARLDSADLKTIAEDNIKITEKLNPELDKCLKNYQRFLRSSFSLSFSSSCECKSSSRLLHAVLIKKPTIYAISFIIALLVLSIAVWFSPWLISICIT